MPTTPNSKLPYPASTDTADVPRDIQNLAVALDQVAYAEFTANVTLTATAAASANTVVTAPAVTFDGATAVMIWFFTPLLSPATVGNAAAILNLWDGSTDLGYLAQVINPAVGAQAAATVLASRRLTPTAAAHTYSVRGWISAGTSATVNAGAGGAGAYLPGYIRIARA